MATGRLAARPPEIPGEAVANVRDFNQQRIAKLNLGGEHSRRCAHAGEEVEPNVSLLDRAQ